MASDFLALDVGGTNTRMALFRRKGRVLTEACREAYHSSDIKSLQDSISLFLNKNGCRKPDACVGFAGPVINGRSKLTNSHLSITLSQIRKAGCDKAYLVNDFISAAAGISQIGKDEVSTIWKGKPSKDGIRVVIGPGTGLGKAYIIGEKIYPAEGGFSSFSAQDKLEFGILEHMAKLYETQIYHEDAVSGRGIYEIHKFLSSTGMYPKNAALREVIESEDPSRKITALMGKDPLCRDTAELFTRFYARFVRDSVLNMLSTDVYLVGNISAAIIPKFKDTFLEEYRQNRKYKDILEMNHIHLVRNPDLGLLGSAAIASGSIKV